MTDNRLKISKKGEDGNRLISVRLREDILMQIDQLSKESNRSRNELINTLLEYAVKMSDVESKSKQ